METEDSPSTSRVAPFGTFAEPPPYKEVKEFADVVDNVTKGKVVPISERPPKPQTARDRERMDAGKQALRELLKERKVKQSKKTSCLGLLKTYITIIAALMIIGGLLVLLFLVPMTIDPALATLNYDIDYEEAICLTLYANQVKRGEDNMWCSCSEGCTKDIFFCHQIYVNYRKNFFQLPEELQSNFNKTAYLSKTGREKSNYVDEVDEEKLKIPTNSDCLKENWVFNPNCWDRINASLYVNIKGCGYPPDVDCDIFLESYNKTGRRFLCFYSKLDPDIVIVDYDPRRTWDELRFSFIWTCGAQAIGIVVIFILHFPFIQTCKSLCRRKPKNK